MLALTALLAALAPPATASASGPPGGAARPRVTIAVVPPATTVEKIAAAVPGISPGLLSAGLGAVDARQTFLDIGQGNRLSGSLYPAELPPIYVSGRLVPEALWRMQLDRAAGAPAEIDPGLLASTLNAAGVPMAAYKDAGWAALMAADREGRVQRVSGCRLGRCPGVTVASVELPGLPPIARRLRGEDLLIAIERPPATRQLLSIGIAGAGFSGDLRSDTTRMDGYALATDIAPTILGRYGIDAPDQISGRAIVSAGGEADLAAIDETEQRLAQISPRRGPVITTNLLIWLALAGVALLVGRRRGAPAVFGLFATSLAWAPGLLLLAGALSPSEIVERLLVGAGAPLLALACIAGLRGRLGERAALAGFAIAAATSVAIAAVDVIAGSPLTTLSLIGPNPGLGVRFFGIGNELEASLSLLIVLGAGAAVAARQPDDPARSVAVVTAAAALAGVAAFAPGRLGADVGAAITLPAGAAATVIAALGLGRRRAILIAAAPVAALALLVAVDLISGGDAHLSRSVLNAGGLDGLGNVLERRLRLGARSFVHYGDSPFFIAVVVALLAALYGHKRLRSWFEGRIALGAAAIGGAAATVVGTLANDSGALLLMIGSAYLAAFCALAWATRAPAAGPRSG